MENPKYQIGDSVHLMFKNCAEESYVLAVVITPMGVLYGLTGEPSNLMDVSWRWIAKLFYNERQLRNINFRFSRYREEMDLFMESKLFPTKQALLDSFLKG